MSYAPNNYSWYPSKGDVTPAAQPGVAQPLLYNPAQQHAQHHNMQQSQWAGASHQPPSQPYWQTNQHQQHQQQEYHQPATAVLPQQNHSAAMQSNQWSTGQSADPWNWGVDDNAAPGHSDASWDWGVQPSESPTPQFAASAQQPPPPNNNASDVGYLYPPPHTAANNANSLGNYHNAPLANDNAVSQPGSRDYTNTNSGNYFVQRPAEQLTAPGLVNYHKPVTGGHLQNKRFDTSGQRELQSKPFDTSDQTNYSLAENARAENVNAPTENIWAAPNENNYAPVDNTYAPIANTYAPVGNTPAPPDNATASLDNAPVPPDNAPTAQDHSFQSLYHNIAGVMGHLPPGGAGCLPPGVATPTLTEHNASDNASDVSGSSGVRYSTLRDVEGLEYLSTTTGTKGLAAQWSTESLHSQGSDDLRPHQAYHYDSYHDEQALGGVCDEMEGLRLAAVEPQSGGQSDGPSPSPVKATPPPTMPTPPPSVNTSLSNNHVSPSSLPPQSIVQPLPSMQPPPSSMQPSSSMQPPSNMQSLPSIQPASSSMQAPSSSMQTPPSSVQPPSSKQPQPSMQPLSSSMQAPPSMPATPSIQPQLSSMQASPPSMQVPPSSIPATPSMQAPPPSMQPPPSTQMPPPGPPKPPGSENPYSVGRVSSHSRYRVSTMGGGEAVNYNVFVPPAAEPQSSEESRSGGGHGGSSEESVNLETLPPDNEEHPGGAAAGAAPVQQSWGSALAGAQEVRWAAECPAAPPDNQEVAAAPGGRCAPDRNQYLETGQLSEEDPPPRGWQRMVPGEGRLNEATPPPGLHRMVPGQVTERDGSGRVSQFADDQSQDSNDDVLLRRMVPGQMTPEQLPRGAAGGDLPPPPGLRRMVPGESSSPESQAPQPGSRVVTGDGRDEADTTLPTAPAAPGAAPAQQPPPTAGERSETIGSDSVETYPLPPQTDNTQRDPASNRRDGGGKHDRHHRDDESGAESDRRGRSKKDYRGGGGGREREESPPGGGGGRRYKADARKGERDRHGNRHVGEERRQGGGKERRGRADVTDSDNYSSDQYGGRYRRPPRDKSSDSRRYERGGRQYEGREGYGRDSRNERDAFNKSRRPGEPRGSDSEAHSDYERRHYDRKGGYNRPRRDADHHGNRAGRYRDDYEYRRRYAGNADSGGRYRETDRGEVDRSRYEASFREKADRRPDSRGHHARMYPPEQQAYSAAPKPQYTAEYYAYYQQLRVTDPVAYAEWYNTVYARQIYPQSMSYSEDRGSVHSGRSSDNNNAYRERDARPQTADPPASSTPQRLTPTFYSTPHVKGSLTSRGQLVKVLPNYPLDGQPATVEIHDVQGLCVSSAVRDTLADFPGPLIKGSTHKNSIIAFCQRRISRLECDAGVVDRDSAILLWQLLILLIKQNGNVVGTDISELLLTSRPAPVKRSSVSSRSSQHGSMHGLDDASSDSSNHAGVKVGQRSEEEVTNTFRDYLLYGNVKEALEWAMRNGLWGHALFLASKTDPRQHANVMMRFANGLPFNDPLQTLYQIKSGRQPAAVTGCSDEKWGSWKPHLAMILANPSSPEVGHKAILTLGDTLAARGCLYAAHFTYLMAQTEFSPWAQRATARLVLIGSSHHHASFAQFATAEAIQMTEVYEYASRLADPDNAIPSFQWFKYVYAQRLMEQNMTSEALLYAEEVGKVLLARPDLYDPGLMKLVYELGDRLKYRDPLYTNDGLDESVELPWLVQLRQTLLDYNLGMYPAQPYPSQDSPPLDRSYSEADPLSQPPPQPDPQPPAPLAAAYDPMAASDGYETALSDEGTRYSRYAEQQQWQQTQQQQQQWQQTQQENTQVYESSLATDANHSQSGYQSQWEESALQAEEPPQPPPQISLPNAYSERRERAAEGNPAAATQPPAAKTKPQSPQARGKQPAGNGWFGGIWNKLSLKPKNQMILPEDKNPTIVWDPDRKRWINMDADGEEVSTELAPPPRASDMPPAPGPAPHHKENGDPAMHTPAPQVANGSAVNKYKLNNKGKSFRSNYVDVFGSSKMAPQSAPPPGLFPLMAGGTQSIFTPGPQIVTNGTDPSNAPADGMFETPHRQPPEQQAPQEVYAPNVSDTRSAYTGPMMYDPRTYAQSNTANQYAH